MKSLLFLLIFVALGISCNTNSEAPVATGLAPDSSTVEPAYPYTLESPYREWQAGDRQHVVTVMKSLKAFEAGDMDGCMTAFGDTVDLRFDGYYAKLAKDSAKKMLTQSRQALAAVKINMADWESVISKDKKHEYVTLWYKEIQTDRKGKVDSLSIVDDIKIVNGKIVEIDQKIQHFPPAQKM